MANRPVFAAGDVMGAVHRRNVEFQWYAGLSDAQKRRCIDSLHEAYQLRYPGQKVLEISSKSREELGVRLSAFNLTRSAPSLDRSVPVECLYQGSKKFTGGGPFTDLYEGRPINAKRDPRLQESGNMIAYSFGGRDYPISPRTAFYNWLWCSAVLEHPDLAEGILRYDAFTDIVFNPEKSSSCQAEAAAIFVGLARRGLLDKIGSFDDFLSLL